MIKTMTAKINGQTYQLTQEEGSGDWVVQIQAPMLSSYNQEGHYYPVELTATDEGGNSTTIDDEHSTFGTNLRLQAKERVAPVITITSPTADAYLGTAAPTITFKVTDNDSGVDTATVVVKVDGKPLEQLSSEATDGGYLFTAAASGLEDGPHTITVDASDHDGNAAQQASVTFTTDTVPPTLNVTAPVEGFKTNSSKLVVSGETNDVTSGPVTLTVNDSPVVVNEGGTFSTEVTLTEGENRITIKATDAAGKQTVITRTVYLDTNAPVFVSVSMTPNPVDCGATFILRVKATDD